MAHNRLIVSFFSSQVCVLLCVCVFSLTHQILTDIGQMLFSCSMDWLIPIDQKQKQEKIGMVNNHHHMNNIYLFNIEHLDSRKEIEKFVTIKLIDWKYFFCGYFQSQKLIDFCLMMTNWNEFNGWVIIIIIIVIINEPLCLLNELFFRFYFSYLDRTAWLTTHEDIIEIFEEIRHTLNFALGKTVHSAYTHTHTLDHH